MAKLSLGAKRKVALLSLGWLLSLPSFAASKHPAPASNPTSENTSLQGWDGNIHPCADLSLPACWKHIPPARYVEKKVWYPVVSLGAGWVINSTVGESQYFPIKDPTSDQFYYYDAQKPSQSGVLFEMFLGSEWAFHPQWALQFGADLGAVYTNYNANGTLTQGADVASQDRFKYNYNAMSKQLMAETKLLYTFKEKIHPYCLLGLGAAFNTAYSYNTNAPPFLTFTRQFSDNTTTAFTYALGLGVDFDATEGIRLGVGYRYADLGKVELGPSSINNVPASGTISQPHMYSNILLGQLTFVF